jgi:hypothetical protein
MGGYVVVAHACDGTPYYWTARAGDRWISRSRRDALTVPEEGAQRTAQRLNMLSAVTLLHFAAEPIH